MFHLIYLSRTSVKLLSLNVNVFNVNLSWNKATNILPDKIRVSEISLNRIIILSSLCNTYLYIYNIKHFIYILDKNKSIILIYLYFNFFKILV